MKIINPATEETIQALEDDSSSTIRKKFDLAKSAQRSWAGLPMKRRLEIISKFRELIVKNEQRLSATLTSEVGKPISQSRNELKGVLARIDFFLEKTEAVLSEERVYDDAKQKLQERVTHEPLGVIANISAWNYPYFVGSNVFIPALLAGNAVLYKPSEFSTLTGLAIAETLHEAGVPKDCFAPVIGSGSAGAELLQLPLDGVFFTGSYSTGRKIAETVGGRLIKSQFELGGKDPVYVCDDVDIASAAAAVADGAFYNTGQSCCSVERIYVQASIFEPFLEKFLETVKGFRVGDPTDESTYIGPLTRGAHLAYLEAQAQDALKKGAKLLCGGKRRPGRGYYFEPTVFTNVDHNMDLMREETFGPMIGIQKVLNDQEALELMNDTEYGLTSGVYSSDRERALKILARANSGSVYWNCCDRVSPRLPWSGRGHSGIGSTLSTYGIQTFTQLKAWHLRQS